MRGLTIAGLGGSIWYNGGENQFTDFTMFLTMLRLLPGLSAPHLSRAIPRRAGHACPAIRDQRSSGPLPHGIPDSSG